MAQTAPPWSLAAQKWTGASVAGTGTTVARIASLVTKAMASKAKVQRLADKVSSIFVPAVLGIALMTIIGWSIAASKG